MFRAGLLLIIRRTNLYEGVLRSPYPDLLPIPLLAQLKDTLKEKCRGKFTKRVLFLHDIAPVHRALAIRKKLVYLGFQCLDHPPYSPDLAPSD